MLTTWILTAVFVVLILCGAYFGAAETAFTAMNKIRMKSLAEEGNARAKTALYIANHYDRALTTLLIGNNITHIGAGAVATTLVLRLWDNGQGLFGPISEDQASFLYGTVAATLVVFLFAEMIPKSKANDRCETMALRYAPSLRFLMKVLCPLAAFFGGITRLVSRLFHAPETPTVTEDELYDIIDTAGEEGVMDEKQSEMMKSAMDFSDTRLEDIMTVREDLILADVALSPAELTRQILSTHHSRLPVYEGTPDHIIGILHIRQYLRAYLRQQTPDVRALLSPPFFAAPGDAADEVFTHMRNEKFGAALVMENGRLRGLVTIEDFLEEIVGEIWDEDDVVDSHFIKLGGNRFLVDTSLTLGDAFRRIGVRLPDRQMAGRTVLSWVLSRFDHFPEEGDTFTYRRMEITVCGDDGAVIDPDAGRIDKVIFRLCPVKTEQPEEAVR